jgi:4-amino-4-deoxy-L-arabinose transferase-like glycosyltransferase
MIAPVSVEPTVVQPARDVPGGAVSQAEARTRVHSQGFSTAIWLTVLVAASAAMRLALGGPVPGPGIVPDEIVYAEFARSLGESGDFLVRDIPFAGWSYGPLYVLLIAPAYLIASLPDAYFVAKAIGVLVMSLTAVPAYFLARRLLDRRGALLAVALVLMLPSMAYSARVMTESLFLPLFVTAVLAFVTCLERPTRLRQLGVLGVITLTVLTRAQAVMLVPAFITAGALWTWLEARSEGEPGLRPIARRLARYSVIWLALAGAAAGAIAVAAARGGSPVALGSLHDGVFSHLELLDAPKWILYHAAQLDLAIGVVPFAAFLLFAGYGLRREADAPARAFSVVSLCVAGWFVAAIGVYATQTPYARVNERYLFYLEPLLLIAFVAWLRAARPRWTPAVLLAAALPLALPYASLLNFHVYAATPGLIPWLDIRLWGGMVAVYIAVGALSASAALLLIRRHGNAQIAVPVVLYLAVSALLVQAAFLAVSRRAVETAGGSVDSAWIDHAVGKRADVVAVWSNRGEWWEPRRLVWVNEFFNRSLGRVYYLYDPETYDLPQTRAHVRGSTVVVGSRALHAEYVLSNGASIAGRRIAERREAGLVLYRVDGPVRVIRGGP